MWIQLSACTLLFVPAIYLFLRGSDKKAFYWVLAAAFLLRLVAIQLDPFLHDWDERFHAIVAKNMMDNPLVPRLRTAALLPYGYEDWCCNYIWVHKPPLFMWQMALSMKIFGVNLFGLRFPDVLMGTLMVFWIWRLATLWTADRMVAFSAALLYAASGYMLDLSAGILSLDHNDLQMGGYVTGSIWAFTEYSCQQQARRWIWIVGLLAGAAVLVKWLIGLLVFGIWGVYLLAGKTRWHLQSWKPLVQAAGCCALVFLPWQLYINLAFPREAAATRLQYMRHFTEPLGHADAVWSHFTYMDTAYGHWMLVALMVLGFVWSWKKCADMRLTWALSSGFLFVYAFFSFLVATKMRGFTFPVSAIGFIWIALGFTWIWQQMDARLQYTSWLPAPAWLLLPLSWVALQPAHLHQERSSDPSRIPQIQNTATYRNLHRQVAPDEVILNCPDMEDSEVRFWQPNHAYHWCPSEQEVDQLLQQGYKLVAFKAHHQQKIPDYILARPQIRILNLELY
jgi:4-amino-4-deoxy-L-arabinose transferase-like glycosyltransferase